MALIIIIAVGVFAGLLLFKARGLVGLLLLLAICSLLWFSFTGDNAPKQWWSYSDGSPRK